jgi:hypothetical protein
MPITGHDFPAFDWAALVGRDCEDRCSEEGPLPGNCTTSRCDRKLGTSFIVVKRTSKKAMPAAPPCNFLAFKIRAGSAPSCSIGLNGRTVPPMLFRVHHAAGSRSCKIVQRIDREDGFERGDAAV